MGLIKSTTLVQVTEAVRQSDPLAHPVVTLAVGSGRHPLLSTLLSCGIGDNDTFFVTLTDRSVLFHKVASTGYRPGKLRYDVEHEQVRTRIGEVRRRPLWSTFRFRFPGDTEAAWLNVRRAWRPEMDRFLDALHGDRHDSPERAS
ncbi:hypothetical protein HEK616_79250 (plasmid) [Streptomyces nigrescens]|uniref:Uncharacterized protein n=2 Tax=Streptomyces TaxID=1883 RepID=A0ABM8A703_STRNI|nr:hypothetical protein [Streptomyces nigrescens]MEE4418857.1 hypothetical protein [Streptomyces sp. DSM 41528]BDM74438.1 hypothetical protein HEK616_79250 [Streptomyces nigrescens]